MPRSAYDNDPWARGMRQRSADIDSTIRAMEQEVLRGERANREAPYTGTQFYGRNYAAPLDSATQDRLDAMSQPISNGAAEFDPNSPRMRNLSRARARDAAKKNNAPPPLREIPARPAPAPYRTAKNKVDWTKVGQAPAARPAPATAPPVSMTNVAGGANQLIGAARQAFPGAFQGGAAAPSPPPPTMAPTDILNISGGAASLVGAARQAFPGAFQGQAGAQGEVGPLGAAFGGGQSGSYTSNANAERAARLKGRGYSDDQIERMIYPERFSDLREAAAANVASRGKFTNKIKASYNGRPVK